MQDVAVKFLHRTSDEDINRFVEVCLKLQHPSTSQVAVHEMLAWASTAV